MKKYFKNLSVVFVVIFLASTLVAGYFLVVLPELIISQLKLTEPFQIEETDQIVLIFRIVVGTSIFIGIIAIIILINIILGYNEKYAQYEHELTEKNKENNENVEQFDVQQDLTENEIKAKRINKFIDPKLDLKKNLDKALSIVCSEIEASQAAIFLAIKDHGVNLLRLKSSYAYYIPDSQTLEYEFGEGLTGQAAKEKKLVNISAIPEGYIKIISGLGKATPSSLVIIPLINKEKVVGIMEISSFKKILKADEDYLQKAGMLIADLIIKDKNFMPVEVE